MSRPDRPGSFRPRYRPVSYALLALWAGAMALFAWTTVFAGTYGWILVAGAVVAAVVLRWAADLGPVAAVPGLGALGLLAAGAPSSPGPEFFGAIATLALLAWLAEDPRRAPGGFARAIPLLLVVFLTVAIAWTCAVLLPPGSALVGVGSALLVAATLLLAVLLGRPDLIDREPPATA